MKDKITFPVTGTSIEQAQTLKEMDLLILRHNPDNEFDSNAVEVLRLEEVIGFCPNRGNYCTLCYSSIKAKDNYCPSCGAGWDHIKPGGLAARLVESNSLNKKYACIVQEINLEKSFGLVTALLVLE
jgi:hypothetical protein